MKLLEGVGEKDTALVFLAGMASGRATAITFCQTMPHESRARVKARAHLIDWGHIQGTLTKSAGTHVLFVDSCHSGGAHNTTLSGDARQEHFVAFAATASAGNAQGSPIAIEHRAFHHGYFTFATVEGLKDKAKDADEHGIGAYSLGAYIAKEVRSFQRDIGSPSSIQASGTWSM